MGLLTWQVGNLAGNTWGPLGAHLGHTWGTLGTHLGHTWGILGEHLYIICLMDGFVIEMVLFLRTQSLALIK